MDIHKPKPWHGVREFLKEYVIIVVGVLTALAAEAGVEWLHWRHLAEHTEADLAASMRINLVNAAELAAIDACQSARIAELAGALRKPGPDWRASPMPIANPRRATYIVPVVYGGTGPLWSHAPWETAQASGVLNHMPRERVARYGDLYRVVEVTRVRGTDENLRATQLAALGDDRKLSDAEKATYLGLLSELENTQHAFRSVARQLLTGAHALGIDPPADEVAQRIARQRDLRGACVTDIKLPLS